MHNSCDKELKEKKKKKPLKYAFIALKKEMLTRILKIFKICKNVLHGYQNEYFSL